MDIGFFPQSIKWGDVATWVSAIGSAAAAGGAVYASMTALKTAKICQAEMRAKDRAWAAISAANILIELQQAETVLRALEMFHSGTKLNLPDSSILTMVAMNAPVNEPVETLQKGHLLLALGHGLDRVALGAAVAIVTFKQQIEATRSWERPVTESVQTMPKIVLTSLRSKSRQKLSDSASKAWHATTQAIAKISDVLEG